MEINSTISVMKIKQFVAVFNGKLYIAYGRGIMTQKLVIVEGRRKQRQLQNTSRRQQSYGDDGPRDRPALIKNGIDVENNFALIAPRGSRARAKC
jgi:hypothetical protein